MLRKFIRKILGKTKEEEWEHYSLRILRLTVASNFEQAFPEYGPTDQQNMIQLMAATVITQRQDIRGLCEILAAVKGKA